MRILVTGSEGNIGKYLVRDLAETYPGARIFRVKQSQLNESRMEGDLFVGDLADSSFADRVVWQAQPDYVLHLAARLYGIAGFNSDIYGLFQNDVLCLLNVLNACADLRQPLRKFVYFSSSMIYESYPCPDEGYDEEPAPNIPDLPPVSSYGLTKYIGEKAVKFFSQQHVVPFTIWRPFNVVSPLESHAEGFGHVFVDFYRKMFVERRDVIDFYGNGKTIRCFTWVGDVTETVARSLVKPYFDNQILNIGSTETTSLSELRDALLDAGKEFGVLPPSYCPSLEPAGKDFNIDVPIRRPNVKKLRELTVWEPLSRRDCFMAFVSGKLTGAI